MHSFTAESHRYITHWMYKNHFKKAAYKVSIQKTIIQADSRVKLYSSFFLFVLNILINPSRIAYNILWSYSLLWLLPFLPSPLPHPAWRWELSDVLIYGYSSMWLGVVLGLCSCRWIIFDYINMHYFHSPFIKQWTSRLFPFPSYCE